jgi:cytochrome P450
MRADAAGASASEGVELNPFSYEFHEDPYPTYRWLRDHAPLYRNDALEFWALSRYADVRDASLDWETYSSAEGTTLERLDPRLFETRPMIIFLDPPRHDRLRKLVGRAFTPRRMAELEPFIRSTVTRLLDGVVRNGGGDFVTDLSMPLPMEVIFTLLGIPEGDRRQLRAWMDVSLERDPDTPAIPERAMIAMASQMQYWNAFVEELRRTGGDGLMAALLQAEVEDDAGRPTRLTDGEIIGFLNLLGAAGNETVTKLLANACVLFARHPGEYGKVLANPGCIPDAVEEVLRYTSPSQYQGRVTTRDVTWYDTTVPRGARILLLTASANRDEREFPDPDRFDVGRRPEQHLGFGYGVHFCLGASLARLESRVTLEEFARRVPRFTVDESRCVRVHMSNVHGYEHVPFRIA